MSDRPWREVGSEVQKRKKEMGRWRGNVEYLGIEVVE